MGMACWLLSLNQCSTTKKVLNHPYALTPNPPKFSINYSPSIILHQLFSINYSPSYILHHIFSINYSPSYILHHIFSIMCITYSLTYSTLHIQHHGIDTITNWHVDLNVMTINTYMSRPIQNNTRLYSLILAYTRLYSLIIKKKHIIICF